jgi:hypothetical protein
MPNFYEHRMSQLVNWLCISAVHGLLCQRKISIHCSAVDVNYHMWKKQYRKAMNTEILNQFGQMDQESIQIIFCKKSGKKLGMTS